MSDLMRIEKEHIHQKIVNQIKNMIKEGSLNPGDKLPTERELSSILGVSRVPIREALKILQFINVLEVKQGRSYTVRGIGRANLLDLLDEVSYKKQEHVLDDLKEIRMYFETVAVKLACERRTDKDLEKMLSSINEMKEAVERKSESDIITYSMNFHNNIMLATHNEFFFVIFSYLIDVMKEGRIKTFDVVNRYEKAILEHIEIYEAIKEKNDEKAIKVIKNHISTSY